MSNKNTLHDVQASEGSNIKGNASMSIYTEKFKFYVYAYLREDLTPYYIGKGSDKRAWCVNRHTKKPKDKSRIIILHENLSERRAFDIEIFYIAWYGRKDLGTGILRNLTYGGDGCSGRKCKQNNKNKFSKLYSKVYVIMDPNKRIFEIENLKKFCKENDLEERNMYAIANGKRKTSKKWQCRLKEKFFDFYTENELSDTNCLKLFRVISPEGVQSTVKNISRFCRENNLTQSSMCQIVKGKQKQHKGWKCEYY